MMGFYDYGFGMGVYGWIMMTLFWGAIVWLIIWLINQNRPHPIERIGRDPKTILKSRYARGEITKTEYRETKKELEEDEN